MTAVAIQNPLFNSWHGRLARALSAWARRPCHVSAGMLICSLFAMGCDDMTNDSRLKPMESIPFRHGSASMHPPEGTIPRDAVATTIPAGDTYPFPITGATLDRGQERYNIYCTPCHGALGDGDGMIVRRGFVRPPSFHEDRLRSAPAGHYVNVITSGYGAMYSYSDRIPVDDRYAITAYVRALQLSRNTDINLLTPDERAQLEKGTTRPQ